MSVRVDDFDSLEPVPVERDLLYSIFVVNRYAKKFDEDAENAYNQSGGAKAKMYSVKKRGLYSLKQILFTD